MASIFQLRGRRVVWAATILLAAFRVASAQTDPGLEPVLRFVTRDAFAGLLERFDAVRPAPASPAVRARALATLPAEGEVLRLNAVQQRKLAAVRQALAWHGREAVYSVKVVDVPQAAVALHARAVLLVSAPALDLLHDGELQALVTHEIGHEYFWNEYLLARQAGDWRRLRTLELLSDGVGILTLRQAGMNPDRLASALEKIIRHNRTRFGRAVNEDHYPTLSDRREFAKRLLRWLGSS